MRIIDTKLLTAGDLAGPYALWIYNGLDNCVTREILDPLESLHTPHSKNVYRFERSLQAPVLAMMRRGVRVDTVLRTKYISEFSETLSRLERHLNLMADAVWSAPLNARSHDQLIAFFYRAMDFKPIVSTKKGEKKISMDREVLEKLREHFFAEPIVSTILAIRDTNGLIKTLSSGVDSDQRIRVSYNIAGTETGRWSSSKNVFGSGTNFQNITPSIRDIFIADEGMMLAYADLEQAESRVVAYVSGDKGYIEACEEADLHSIVAKMVFGVSGEDVHKSYYRHFSYRDIAKRAGHATNYMATPYTLSKRLKIPVKTCEEFQHLYFSAFPGIRDWHKSVQVRLQTEGKIVTALGRERQFFGRKFEDATLREAIAYEPQSTVADILNIGLLSIYTNLEPKVQLLAQVHDAVLFQFPENDLPLAARASSFLSIPIKINSQTMTIPVETKVGFDWKNMEKLSSPKVSSLTRRAAGTLLDQYI